MLLLGDRFEIFAAAIAAATRHIPIAHISGGDVTLGAADEYYRHCITKMAAVHFPSCADSAARLVVWAKLPKRCFCVGGLGDENIRTLPKMSREELCNSTGFPLQQPFALVTYHPETSADAGSPAAQSEALCAAMEAVPGVYWLITGSNADAGGQICTARMQRFAAEHPDRAGFIKAWDCGGTFRPCSTPRWWRAIPPPAWWKRRPLRCPPSISASARRGRAICANVLCCDAEEPVIEAALRRALSPEFAATAATAQSPYGGGGHQRQDLHRAAKL